MKIDEFSDVLLLILGWLLGTMSPAVVDAIKDRRRRTALLAAIAVELHELRYLLALVVTRVHEKFNSLDQASHALTKPLILSYKGQGLDAKLRDAMTKLLASGDDEYIALVNARPDDGKGLYPVRYEAPLLEAHVGDLLLFPVATQQLLLRVSAELHLFNQQVDLVQRSHDRTFDGSLHGANHALNRQNLESSTQKIAVRATEVVESINKLMDANGKLLV